MSAGVSSPVWLATKFLQPLATNHSSQHTATIDEINNQKTNTESSHKRVGIGQAFGEDMQQIIESDVEGSKIKIRKDKSEDMQQMENEKAKNNMNIQTDIAKNNIRGQVNDVENVQILYNDEMHIVSRIEKGTKSKVKFRWRLWGSSLTGLHTLDPPLGPSSAEFFQRTCPRGEGK